MRIIGKLNTIGKALALELCILGFIALVYFFQYSNASEEYISKTRAIAGTIGDQAGVFFANTKDKASTDEFFVFLDERLGRKKLFDTFEIAPKFFSVVLRSDIERGGMLEQFAEDLYPANNYTLRETSGFLSVSVPFLVKGDPKPYGIVKIDSDTKSLMENVFYKNFLFYAAILVVLNNQAFILHLLLRKKKEVVFEKGYIKDHSVGALKIFHRVLGDIITDHEQQMQEKSEDDVEIAGDVVDNSENTVVSISKLMDKKSNS